MRFSWPQPKYSNFELKSSTNMALSDKLSIVWKSGKLGFSFAQ